MRPLHYALKYGQGGELCYPDTWLQTKDVSSTLLPETMVDSDGLEPPSRKASTCRSTLELRVRILVEMEGF